MIETDRTKVLRYQRVPKDRCGSWDSISGCFLEMYSLQHDASRTFLCRCAVYWESSFYAKPVAISIINLIVNETLIPQGV